MCLITNQKEPLIAEEDINVHKYLTEDLRAMYYPFQYMLDFQHETEIKEAILDKQTPNWCFFATEDERWAKSVTPIGRIEDNPELICFSEGFHSIKPDDKNDMCCTGTRFHAIIPKGSQYYKNPIGLYVSNKLIIIKKLS